MVGLYRHFDEFKEALLYLHQYQGKMEGLNVLEAGCGVRSNLNLIDCVLTGIDISQNQLNRNNSLQFKVCADLQTYENEAWNRSFDLIVCWDVLEHLVSLPVVIKKFRSWIKDERSRLILVFPNAQTFKGYVTKYSPPFLHKLFYKLTLDTPIKAARTDQGPFKTFFSDDLNLDKLIGLLNTNSFDIPLLLSFESYQNKWIKRYLPAKGINRLNKRLLSPYKDFLDPSATDFILVAAPRA
jgi:hypothetical protein